MRGVLADANVDGLLSYLRRVLEQSKLLAVLKPTTIEFATLSDLSLSRVLSDREIWEYCQKEGWILFTDNRNHQGTDSLEETLQTRWKTGSLPVVTLANKMRFQREADYVQRVADDLAELLCGIILDAKYCDERRIYVPRH
jgi:hypothetical protein